MGKLSKTKSINLVKEFIGGNQENVEAIANVPEPQVSEKQKRLDLINKRMGKTTKPMSKKTQMEKKKRFR